MSEAAWGFAGVVVVQVVGVVIVWLNILANKRETKEAKNNAAAANTKADEAKVAATDAASAATEAADLARPTGNGFANDVRNGLEDLRNELRQGMLILTRATQSNTDGITQLNGAMLRHIIDHEERDKQ